MPKLTPSRFAVFYIGSYVDRRERVSGKGTVSAVAARLGLQWLVGRLCRAGPR
jgi:hypothetical protein